MVLTGGRMVLGWISEDLQDDRPVDRLGRSHAGVDAVGGLDGSQMDHGVLVEGRAGERLAGRIRPAIRGHPPTTQPTG